MTSKVIKITSRQNQSITSSKNLIDFDVPAGVYDLSKSYLNLNVSLPSQNQNNITLLNLARDATNPEFEDNVDFVRNCSMRSLTGGVIENVRHVNILKKNQQLYEKSVSKNKSSEVIAKMGCMLDLNSLGSSNYRTIEKLGSTLSKDKDHDNIIRLKDLMNFCKNDYYDTQEKGDLQLHFEMNVDNFVVFQQLKANDYLWEKKFGVDTNPAYTEFADIGGAQTVTELSTKKEYFNIDESPFYVGQRLAISGTDLTAGERQILSIDYNTDYTLKLTFDSGLVFAGASTDVAGISVNETASNSPVFNRCELVLVEVDRKSGKNNYEYTTYNLQEDTVNTTALNKNYHLSPMTKNVFVITPSTSTQFLSDRVVTSYRTSVNNEFQQNRPVLFGTVRDSLHLSQVMKTYDNKDEPLKNTVGMVTLINRKPNSPFDANNRYTYMVMEPVPITKDQKLFGLELNGPNAFSRIMIFEEIIKSF